MGKDAPTPIDAGTTQSPDRSSNRQHGHAHGHGRRQVVQRRVNGRFLLILLVSAAAIGAGVHFVHRAMVAGNATEIRDRAVAAREAGETSKAIGLYAQYRKLRPDDLGATIAMADLLRGQSDSRETSQRVYEMLESVLRQDPARHEVRRTLVDTALKLGLHADADTHLDALIEQEEPGEVPAELYELKAEVQEGLRQFAEAGGYYVLAIQADRQRVEPYAALTRVLTKNPEAIRSLMAESNTGSDVEQTALSQVIPGIPPGAGPEIVGPAITSEMVAQGKPTWRALMERARIRQSAGQIAAALEDSRQARKSPEARRSPEAMLTAALMELSAAQSRTDQDTETPETHLLAARRIARAGVDAGLAEPLLFLVLAEVEMRDPEGQPNLNAAIALLESGVEQSKSLHESAKTEEKRRLLLSEIELRWNLANYRLDAAMLDRALTEEVLGETESSIALLTGMGCRRELTDFLAVRLDILRGNWGDAAQMLETLRLRVMDMPRVRRRVDAMLASAYGQLQNPDQKVETFRRAIADDPLWLAARVGLAGALEEAGQFEEAIENYARLIDVPGIPERLARLLTITSVRATGDDETMEKIEALIAKADQSRSAGPALQLLRVELLIARGDFAGADEAMGKIAEQFPESPVAWQARLEFAAIRGDLPRDERVAEVEALLAEGKSRFGDCVEVRLGEAELAALRDGGSFAETIERLSSTPDSFSRGQRARLLEQLARVARRAGEPEVERGLWEAIARGRSNSLPAWIRVAEFAVEAQDKAATEEALSHIREIEGPAGPNGDFISAYDKIIAANSDPALRGDPERLARYLAEPREMLARAAEERTYWATVPRAQGLLEALAGNDEAALEFRERAWQLGDHTMALAGALIRQYQKNNQPQRAALIVRQLQSLRGGAGSGVVAQMAVKLKLQRGDIDGAVETARQQADNSGALRDQLALANVLFLKYRSLGETERGGEDGKVLLKQAQQAYADALEAHPGQPEGWVSYVQFLGALGQQEAAEKTIELAERRLADLPAAERTICLARCQAVLGHNERAAELFEQAVASDPKDVSARMLAADYLSRAGKLEKATGHVEWILDPEHGAPQEAVDWARRRSAFILAASRGRHEDVIRAIEMLRGDAKTGRASVADLRAQVALLAGRGSANDRQMMLGILEEISKQTELTPEEKFQMVALYESAGQWPRARTILEELRDAEQSNPRYLSAYIVGRVRHEPATDEAAAEIQPLLTQLEGLEPHTLRTTLARAEYENHFASSEEAGVVLAQFAEYLGSGSSRDGESVSEEEQNDIQTAAAAAAELGADEAALALYRQLSEVSQNPRNVLPLVTHLARSSQYDEALALLEEASAKLRPDATAVTAVNIVSLGTPAREQIAQAEALVVAALEKEPESLRIRTAMAGLRSVQGRYDESESLYRAILEKQPNNPAVLNNLAWLLMVAGKDKDEAARLIEEAIAVAGPVSDLVDTRGTIDLARGQIQTALDDLQAAYDANPNATIGFHLAVALSRLGREDDAQKMYAEAREMGLDLNLLHPSEHAAYEELAAKFDGP